MDKIVYKDRWQQINVRLNNEEKEAFEKECQKIGKAKSNVLRSFIQIINTNGFEFVFSPNLIEELNSRIIDFESDIKDIRSENESLHEQIENLFNELKTEQSKSVNTLSDLKESFKTSLSNKKQAIDKLQKEIKKLNKDLQYQNNNSVLRNSELALLVENYFIQARKAGIFNRKFSFEEFTSTYINSNYELLKAFIKVDMELSLDNNLSTKKLITIFENNLK